MTDGSPPTTSDRIAAIQGAMTDDAEAGASFAEPVRASVEAALARLDIIVGTAPHAEAAALLDQVRDRVSGLDPTRLEPRRGLGGLFDSRSKRLKAFRASYLSIADAAASGSADLADRGGAIARRGDDLEALWNALRTDLSNLDDHVAAGRAWLADRAAPPPNPVPPEAAAAFEESPETLVEPEPVANDEMVQDPEPVYAEAGADKVPATAPEATPEASRPEDEGSAPAITSEAQAEQALAAESAPPPPAAEIAALPHPLVARLEALAALRARAVAALPRIRAFQNADHAVPAALASAREAVETWRADWRDALGLAGRKPKKIRPDATRLVESRDALVARTAAAGRVVASAQARLAELTPRSPPPPAEVRAAA